MPEKYLPSSEWISSLANAISRLDEHQLQTLASIYMQIDGRPALSSWQLQQQLHLSTTGAIDLARRLEQLTGSSHRTARDTGIALTTLAWMKSREETKTEKIEVVCTTPFYSGVRVRTTYATALEMIKEARQEIFVVGYLFTGGAKGLVETLATVRRDRGLSVTVIGNRMEDYLGTLRVMWTSDCPGPDVFTREADIQDEMAALHAKLLICDRTTALVTSANFSHHGLHENIEIGIKVQSASVSLLAEFVQTLITSGQVKQICWT